MSNLKLFKMKYYLLFKKNHILKKIRKLEHYFLKLKYFNLIYKVIYSFYIKEGFQRANSLAYVFLMSFVPFFISIASIITWFMPLKFYAKLEQIIFTNFLPSTGNLIASYMSKFHAQAEKLSLISLLFLFITSVSMIFSLKNHLEHLWSIKHSKVSLSFSVLRHLILMTIGPTLLGLSLIASSYLSTILPFNSLFIFNLLSGIVSIMAYTIIYKVVPGAEVKLRHAFIAGLFAGILFEIAKTGFNIYINYFATENILYGTLATIPIFLLWIYICSIILLLCAQIVYVLKHNYPYKSNQ